MVENFCDTWLAATTTENEDFRSLAIEGQDDVGDEVSSTTAAWFRSTGRLDFAV